MSIYSKELFSQISLYIFSSRIWWSHLLFTHKYHTAAPEKGNQGGTRVCAVTSNTEQHGDRVRYYRAGKRHHKIIININTSMGILNRKYKCHSCKQRKCNLPHFEIQPTKHRYIHPYKHFSNICRFHSGRFRSLTHVHEVVSHRTDLYCSQIPVLFSSFQYRCTNGISVLEHYHQQKLAYGTSAANRMTQRRKNLSVFL